MSLNPFISHRMKLISLFAILFFLGSCEYNRFDKDKRQIIAKDILRSKAPRNRSFDITGFREDTLTNYPDTNFKKPLLYTMDFTYTDSSGNHNKRGLVVFSPDGRTVINSKITDR